MVSREALPPALLRLLIKKTTETTSKTTARLPATAPIQTLDVEEERSEAGDGVGEELGGGVVVEV